MLELCQLLILNPFLCLSTVHEFVIQFNKPIITSILKY